MTTDNAILVISNMFQFFVMGYFIGDFIQVRHRWRFVAFFTVLFTLITAVLINAEDLQSIVVYAAIFVIPLIFGRIPKWKSILYVLIGLLVMNLIADPIYLLVTYIYPEARVTTDYPASMILWIRIMVFPALVLAWYFTTRVCRKLLHTSSESDANRYMPFFIIELIAIALGITNSKLGSENYSLTVLFSIGILLAMLVIDLLLARTIRQLNRAHETELELQQAQSVIRNQADTYAMFQSQMLSLHRVRHDTANQLSSIAYLLDQKDYVRAQQQLSAFRDSTSQLASRTYTGNSVIDAVINVKLIGAGDHSFSFRCDGTLPADLPIDAAALCSAVSNLLDNAIHACEALAADAPAEIRLNVGIRQNYLILRCVNPCGEDTQLPGDGLPNAQDVHGWGIHILRQIAAQHDGNAAFSIENGLFTAEIQLNLDHEAE